MTLPDGGRPDEFALIARYFAPIARHAGAFGLSDDAATLVPPGGSDLVLTKDILVAGSHFFPDDPPAAIAMKALRVNLSDLAAKGAAPLGFMLGIALPGDWSEAWLGGFAGGLAEDAGRYEVPLLGGDTVKARGALVVSITALGHVPAGTMVRRGGARPGDRLYVSGTIGDAALGLTLREEAGLAVAARHADHLKDRYLLPQPRLALAPALRASANAAMDVSDGLAGDLAKLLKASGATGRVDVARLPLSDASTAILDAAPGLIDTVLSGGDDYEILAAVPPERSEAFEADAGQANVRVTCIGEVVAGEGPPRFLLSSGEPLRLGRASYSHF